MSEQVYPAIAELLARRGSGCVATVVAVSGSAPQRVGAKLLAYRDGSFVGTIGGGRVEQQVLEHTRTLRAPETVRYELTAALGMCCGGTMEIFFEPLCPPERLLLFGAGHVGRAIGQAARAVGFHVVVIDPRPDWASAARFPGAELVVREPLAALDGMAPGAADYAVIATHAHELDQDVLLALCRRELAYLGMIGSRRKVLKAMRRLEGEGVPEALRASIFAPIGLDLGAVTPEEIAVAFLAEAVRRRRRPESIAADAPVQHMRSGPRTQVK